MPTPGFRILTTSSPTTRAMVDSSSKYSRALAPTLPTSLRSPIRAMPTTIVAKMTGASSILINLMKPSPNGFMSVPRLG